MKTKYGSMRIDMHKDNEKFDFQGVCNYTYIDGFGVDDETLDVSIKVTEWGDDGEPARTFLLADQEAVEFIGEERLMDRLNEDFIVNGEV